PRVPKGLEAICLKCLEKDPGRRYATAREVAEALRAWAHLGDAAPGATAHPPSDSRPPPGTGGGENSGHVTPAWKESPSTPGGGESPPGADGHSARSGWRRALVAVGASALLVAAGFILIAPWMRRPGGPGPTDGAPGSGEVPVKVKGHETIYRDFALKVEM